MPFEATITSIHRMTARVKQFVVEAEEAFDFEPGQHTTSCRSSTRSPTRTGRARPGHIQGHLDDRLDGLDRDFYVCGVPGMVVDTKDELAELGIDDDRVFSEGWEDGEVED